MLLNANKKNFKVEWADLSDEGKAGKGIPKYLETLWNEIFSMFKSVSGLTNNREEARFLELR